MGQKIGFHAEYNKEATVLPDGRIGKLIDELIDACKEEGLPLVGGVCFMNNGENHGLRMFGHAPEKTMPADLMAAKVVMDNDDLTASTLAGYVAKQLGLTGDEDSEVQH